MEKVIAKSGLIVTTSALPRAQFLKAIEEAHPQTLLLKAKLYKEGKDMNLNIQSSLQIAKIILNRCCLGHIDREY